MSSNTTDAEMGCQEAASTVATPEAKLNNQTDGLPPSGDGSSTSEQPDSPLSSTDISSRTSPQNTTDSDVPVLTPVNNESETRKRKADDCHPETSTSAEPEKQAEVKRPKLEEETDNPRSPSNSSSLAPSKPDKEDGSTENTKANTDARVHDNEASVDMSMKALDKSQDSSTSKSSSQSSSSPSSSDVKPESGEKVACSDGKPPETAQGDSDKENTDVPIDLSLGVKGSSSSSTTSSSSSSGSQTTNTPSSDTKPLVNGFKEMTPEQLKERRHLVKRLQDELRNEEAKLVLLKKIRQSQLLQHLHDAGAPTKSMSSSVTSRLPQAGPPPLVKGDDEAALHRRHYGTSGHTAQVSKVLTSQHSHAKNPSHSLHSNGPPPLVMAPAARGQSLMNHKSHHQQLVSSSRTSSHAVSSSHHSQSPSHPEQTPAQRQAAAKLALRKQLEKTLLQIPPPKPPPPEMNFIPSLAGSDFMVLVGLEEVVKFIIDLDVNAKDERGPEVKYVFNPFVCVQCGTDFTPVWKRDKPGSKNVICEQCVTTNQKKALKQEHTNRLKSAFVKALQQEQEIEQRMQAQTLSASSSSSHRSSKERERGERDREHALHREELDLRASRSAHSHSVHSSSHSSHHGSSSSANPVNLSTSFKATNEQIRQHQNLIQAHQAQLRGAAALSGLTPAFNPRLMFQFSPQHLATSSSKADLQRQYLLDMIPPRSLPGSNALWRT